MILTWDNLAHFAAAAALAYLLSIAGTWGTAIAVTLIFVAREAEQSGNRWEPWTWGLHKHVEWLSAAVGALIVAGLIAALR